MGLRRIFWLLALTVVGLGGCGRGQGAANAAPSSAPAARPDPVPAAEGGAAQVPHLPLVLLANAPLPGHATRFDYQDIDPASGHLVIAHMNDSSVLVVDVRDGSVLKELTGIPTARGVVIAGDVGRIFVTSSPDKLVIIDNASLNEIARVGTGRAPDGVGWDPTHKVVGVSDQADGALSLLSAAGSGARKQVRLGSETGNVVFDMPRGWFWITVVKPTPPDELVAVDPVSGNIADHIALPGCRGAHGLRLHPDGQSAFVACEDNDKLARVGLTGSKSIVVAPTGHGPDVLSIDPGWGWLYVAAESGDLTIFDIGKPGVTVVGHENPGPASHSVAVDPATHRLFFPLMRGPKGEPVLRIMRPSS
jgi:DNA-binding beta-propeller fold protein YncE